LGFEAVSKNDLSWLVEGGNMFPRSFLVPVAGIAILAAAAVADAQPRRVQVGTLSCSVSAGIGLIVALIGDGLD
jgi:hypothetical protein